MSMDNGHGSGKLTTTTENNPVDKGRAETQEDEIKQQSSDENPKLVKATKRNSVEMDIIATQSSDINADQIVQNAKDKFVNSDTKSTERPKLNDKESIKPNPANEDEPILTLDEVKTFEDLLNVVGTNGWRNYFILVCCGWASVVGPMHTISYQFLGAIPDHWCAVPDLRSANWTTENILNLTVPIRTKDCEALDEDFCIEGRTSNKQETCVLPSYNYTLAIHYGWSTVTDDRELITDPTTNLTFNTCSVREFDSNSPPSVSTEWDLVCNRKWLYSFTQFIVMMGKLVGSFTTGYMLDIFGRRRVLTWAVPAYIIIGFSTSFTFNIWSYLFLKFLNSTLGMTFYMGGMILAMELCSAKQRSYVGSLSSIPWSIGYMAVPVIAYLVQPWRYMQAALTVPALTSILTVWKTPESPRWLMLQGRYDEAYKILRQMAKGNGRELEIDQMKVVLKMLHDKEMLGQDVEGTEPSSYTSKITRFLMKVTAILRNRTLLPRAMMTFFCWFAVALVYYGISLNSTQLSTNKYIYVFLGGLTELPSYLLLGPTIAYFGRTRTLRWLFFTCAACILVVMIMIITMEVAPTGWMMFLSLVGKFAITGAFTLIWMFTAELFPTEHRSLALGEASVCARFGSGISPFINDIWGEDNKWAPSALFGVMSLAAGIVCGFLPDTTDQVLSDAAPGVEDDQGKTNKAYQVEEGDPTYSHEKGR